MKQIILILTIFSVFTTYGQQVVSSGGTSFENFKGQIEYTIGEPVIQLLETSDCMITQGYHQPTLSIIEVRHLNADFIAEVFPNPTVAMLKLKLENFEGVSYQVFNADGKNLESNNVTNNLTSIDVQSFTKGYYTLRLIDADNKKLKSYKFLKN